jgi:hypothetical protein
VTSQVRQPSVIHPLPRVHPRRRAHTGN